MEERSGEEHRGTRCAECGAPLAHDQRYCVECGTRRSAIPQYVSALIALIFERGRRVASPARQGAGPARPPADPLVKEKSGGVDPLAGEQSGSADPLAAEEYGSADPWVVTPRAAAAAVLGMLGFGVIVGALVGGAGAALLRPILVNLSPVQSAPATRTSPPSSGSSSPGSAGAPTGPRTITITSSNPSAGTTPSGGGGGGGGGGSGHGGGKTTPGPLPPIKHVFLIVLSDEGYQQTFGHSTDDPYLATTLVKQGFLIPNYYAVAQSPLANEVALVSGQGPTRETVDDCPVYNPIQPGTPTTYGQYKGHGCAYPKAGETLANELAAAHMTWKAYIQVTQSPADSKLESCFPKQGSRVKTDHIYGPWLDPFLYFQAMAGKSTSSKGCLKDAVNLGQLKTDLKKPQTTPALSYIVADLCDDGNPLPCAKHSPAGMGPADTFLKSIVPEIMNSAAYKSAGMIAITFDNAPQSGPFADSSSCCDTPAYPNVPSSGATGTGTAATPPPTTTTTTSTTPTPTSTTSSTPTTTTTSSTPTTTTSTTSTTTTTTTTSTTTTSPAPCSTAYGGTCPTGGGGQVGLLVLSKWVKPGEDPFDYFDHFSLLASLESIWNLTKLGYADNPSLTLFSATNVFKAYTP